ADGRAPAHADADAGVPVRVAVEGAAAIHEQRPAPGVVEVVLVLEAGCDDILGADAEVADARADLAVVVAADAAVAAGVEAQAGRQLGDLVGPGAAELAARDQAVEQAEPAVPVRPQLRLHEAGVGGAAGRRRAQVERAAQAVAREDAVVGVDVL